MRWVEGKEWCQQGWVTKVSKTYNRVRSWIFLIAAYTHHAQLQKLLKSIFILLIIIPTGKWMCCSFIFSIVAHCQGNTQKVLPDILLMTLFLRKDFLCHDTVENGNARVDIGLPIALPCKVYRITAICFMNSLSLAIVQKAFPSATTRHHGISSISYS